MPPVSFRVVEAIADEEGVEPAALRPPLASVVDPTALDQLFEWSEGHEDAMVRFHYPGYRVSVAGDGDVSVEVAEAETDARGSVSQD